MCFNQLPSCTDNKPVEPSKPPSVEKMDNGHKQPEKLESWHKQLEKSDSGNKLVEKMENGHKLLEKTESDSKLTSVGVDGVTKPLDPKATIGSQTSVDQESQYDQVDSPPLSPPSTTSVVSMHTTFIHICMEINSIYIAQNILLHC